MKREILEAHQSGIRGPLTGVLVLGFCYYVAGPMALQSLVQQGALVIKVEKAPIGDPSRRVFSKGVFNSLSYGQMSLLVDPKNPEDIALLAKIMRLADVIVDNRSIRAKEADLRLQKYLNSPDKKQSVVYCSIDGFPNPTENRMPGLDASVQAATGLPYTNCTQGRPMKVGAPILDQMSGLLAANQILANLCFLRGRSGGRLSALTIRLGVSLAGVSMWIQTGQVLHALNGHEYLRKGNEDMFAVPFSYYKTKNGLISIATVNEEQFFRFCKDVLEDMCFYEEYPSIDQRLKKQDQFSVDLDSLLVEKTKEEWFEICKKNGVPASPVLTVTEAIRQPFVRDELMRSTQDGMPIVVNGATNSIFDIAQQKPRPAPRLGQDNELLRSRL